MKALTRTVGTGAMGCEKLCWEEEQRNGPVIIQGRRKQESCLFPVDDSTTAIIIIF